MTICGLRECYLFEKSVEYNEAYEKSHRCGGVDRLILAFFLGFAILDLPKSINNQLI